MVDVVNLSKSVMLLSERTMIEQALNMFDEGGRIISLTLAKEDAEPSASVSPPVVSVLTRHMDYPPQMVDAIKSFLQQRDDQITQELQHLGVTGVQSTR